MTRAVPAHLSAADRIARLRHEAERLEHQLNTLTPVQLADLAAIEERSALAMLDGIAEACLEETSDIITMIAVAGMYARNSKVVRAALKDRGLA
ncbi:MAG: hypothetical protein ACK4RV_02345 [Caulobacter sp.]